MPQPSEDFLHRMYERSPVGFYRSTFDGRFLFVNPALVRMLRYERADEVMQLDLARDVYCDPADRTRLIAQYRETGTLDGLKVRWKTRGGAPLVVQLYGYLMPELDCIDATVIEVTELDAAQTRIEQQRQELERGATAMRLLWRQLPGLVWTVDRELTITFADGAAAPQLGHTIKGELGRSLYDFYGTDRDSYLPIRRHLEALEGRWVSFHQEVDGKQYAVTLGPQRAENGAIIGVVGVGLDVTTRHRLEQRMVDAQRAESLGVLAGGLAHDFNNLLAAILGNVSLGLREVPSGAPGHGVLESIRAGALDAAGLTSQLLAYAGRGELTTSDLTLAPILDELLRLAAPQIPAEVKVAVELPPELPPIRGDAGQLRQVVMNLVTNARDALAGRAGTITLTAQVLEHDGAISEHEVLAPPSAGRFVALSVADDGPGIDGDTLRRIFDPFFSTKPNGHGLGLASVLGIVRSHGGGISVYSRPGAGDEALALLDGGAAVDCAILDLTMPGMSGGELLEAVRQRRPQLPIVVCSGHERDGKAMPAAEGFLAKPFRLEALEGMLAKLIGAASSAEAAAAARSAGEVASSSSSSQSSSTSSQSSSQSSSSSGDPGALRA
jgi:PAS domain S-box-containing protein